MSGEGEKRDPRILWSGDIVGILMDSGIMSFPSYNEPIPEKEELVSHLRVSRDTSFQSVDFRRCMFRIQNDIGLVRPRKKIINLRTTFHELMIDRILFQFNRKISASLLHLCVCQIAFGYIFRINRHLDASAIRTAGRRKRRFGHRLRAPERSASEPSISR